MHYLEKRVLYALTCTHILRKKGCLYPFIFVFMYVCAYVGMAICMYPNSYKTFISVIYIKKKAI